MLKKEELKQMLQASIEEVFSVFLFEEALQAVFSFLERRFGLGKDEVLNEPKKFVDGLKVLLGPEATVMLKLIAKDFASKLGIDYKKSRSFEEHIEEAKKLLMENTE